jgi:NOL1/NOP2/sun family putative RNA methylase
MSLPPRLLERLKLLNLDESVYTLRSRKCILSRENLSLKQVPWYKHAYYVHEGFKSKDSPIFDPVSLVPCMVLDPKKDDCILDMCAAPGTKTFILSFLTENKATITANDVDMYRVMRLKNNTKQYGINCTITNTSGRLIKGSFNKILLDAPCSGEGMVNKQEKVFLHWSEKHIRFLAKKQKKLIKQAFKILESGGILVYSTCTFAPEENEGVIDFLLSKNDNAVMQDINVNIKHANGITFWNGIEFDRRLAKCIRIYPNMNLTCGFFAAKIRKE